MEASSRRVPWYRRVSAWVRRRYGSPAMWQQSSDMDMAGASALLVLFGVEWLIDPVATVAPYVERGPLATPLACVFAVLLVLAAFDLFIASVLRGRRRRRDVADAVRREAELAAHVEQSRADLDGLPSRYWTDPDDDWDRNWDETISPSLRKAWPQ